MRVCIWLDAFGTGERQPHFIVNPFAHLRCMWKRLVVITQHFCLCRSLLIGWSLLRGNAFHFAGELLVAVCTWQLSDVDSLVIVSNFLFLASVLSS